MGDALGLRAGGGAIYGRAGQRSHTGLDELILAAMSKQGAQITMTQVEAWAIEGHQFHAQQGDAGTLLDFVAQAYDENRPQFTLRVPNGTVVLPTSISLNFQDQGGTDTHVIVATATNDIGLGTSTVATISAMRRDAPFGNGKCTAASLLTGDSANAPAGVIEILRNIDQFVETAAGRLAGFQWDRDQSSVKPILIGPATMMVYAFGSDGPQGFAEYTWIELDTHKLVEL